MPSLALTQELVISGRPDKRPRAVLNVRGDLRKFQANLLKNVLRPKHQPSEYSHGGVRGRNIKTNARAHDKSVFVFSTDIENFYPRISHDRVFELFLKGFGCSPAVSRICTQLCTYRHHLALGLITSPILADCIMKPVDVRIADMCRKAGLIYTRFVDDIVLSGRYPIKSGSYPNLVADILQSYGFAVNLAKHKEGLEGAGRFDEGKCVTKPEIKRGRIRVRKEYIVEVSEQLADGARLAAGHAVQGIYYMMPVQIRGRIQFMAWINKGQAAPLQNRYRATDWDKAQAEASLRGLVAPTKELRPMPDRQRCGQGCVPPLGHGPIGANGDALDGGGSPGDAPRPGVIHKRPVGGLHRVPVRKKPKDMQFTVGR
jgi:RNA-directed DNA polymerase